MPAYIVFSGLFDFCTGTYCSDGITDARLLQLLGNFTAHGFQGRKLGLTRVIEADDVIAELCFHRRLGDFTFLQARKGVGELFHERTAVRPVEFAAFLG
jgi:hypothetical protein